ncbi:hypothetical protein D3C71_1394320 [compost metagenome]
MNNKELVEKSIESIAKQIEILSSRCQIEENRKTNYNFQNTLDASALMFQLSKSLGELVLIDRVLEQGEHTDMLNYLAGGRRN